jgi:hypothetical protein
MAELLLSFGANVNVPLTAVAFEVACPVTTTHLLGFTCECQKSGEDSPMGLAATSQERVNFIPRLFNYGAKLPDCDVLLLAINHGASLDTVRHIIRNGADPDQCSFVI